MMRRLRKKYVAVRIYLLTEKGKRVGRPILHQYIKKERFLKEGTFTTGFFPCHLIENKEYELIVDGWGDGLNNRRPVIITE